jgi:Ca2+-dependent lipid-binding protein
LRFEEALAFELEAIPSLSNKVYPLVVAIDKSAPYIAYVSNEGQKLKTLSGYIDNKSISSEVNIVGKTYADLKQLTTATMDKLCSFENRNIGDGTVFIQEVYFGEPVEAYESDADLYRSTIPFQVYL